MPLGLVEKVCISHIRSKIETIHRLSFAKTQK